MGLYEGRLHSTDKMSVYLVFHSYRFEYLCYVKRRTQGGGRGVPPPPLAVVGPPRACGPRGEGSWEPTRVAKLAYFRPENTNLAYFELLGCKILAFGIFPKIGIFLGILAVSIFSLYAKPDLAYLAYFQSQ